MATPTGYRGPQWVVPQLIIGSTECIICFGSLCYSIFVYKTYQPKQSYKKKTNSLSNSLKFMNAFGIISFLCSSITHCINIYVYNTFYWQYSQIQTLTWYCTYLFWSIAQFISYLLFVDRIIVSFKNSIYEPTKTTILFLYALPIIFILTWTAANIVPFFTIHDKDLGLDRNYLIEFYMSIPITILDILITISMTYIFTSRLYQVILAQTTIEYHENMSMSGISVIENSETSLIVSKKYNKLIKVSVKITILSVTSLLSSLILITFRSISYWYKWGTILDKFHTIWLQLDTIISCLCLVLFLPKTQKGFELLCCCCNAILSKGLIQKSLHSKTLLNVNLNINEMQQ